MFTILFPKRKFHIICLGGLNTDLRQLQIPMLFNRCIAAGNKITPVGVTGFFNVYPPLVEECLKEIHTAISNTPSTMGVVLLGISIDSINVVKYAIQNMNIDGIILLNPFFRYEICPYISEQVTFISSFMFPNMSPLDFIIQKAKVLPLITEVSPDSPLLVRVKNVEVPKITFEMIGNAIRYKNEHIKQFINSIEYKLAQKPCLFVTAQNDLIAESYIQEFFNRMELDNAKHVYRTVQNANHFLDAADPAKGTREQIVEKYLYHIFNFIETL